MSPNAPLFWKVVTLPDATLVTFEINSSDGLLDHNRLLEVTLPSEVHGREPLGLIISGRGPIWLYGYLVHRAHPFAWLAVHDPRLGAVVIARHTSSAPALGSVIPLPAQA